MCPPLCIGPIKAAEGVASVGEVGVVDFMEGVLRGGKRMLIGVRVQEWHERGTIP